MDTIHITNIKMVETTEKTFGHEESLRCCSPPYCNRKTPRRLCLLNHEFLAVM
uniref:Uncharacterized protein n=1 Tax=Rhizophora mucronata TaxID=61149 RepID=A0A2P2KWC9_RHIMU